MFKRYGIIGVFRLFCSLVYTRALFPNARLIRLPFDIRNRHSIFIGDRFTSGFWCRIEAYPKTRDAKSLIIGRDVEINDFVHISAGEKVSIGDNVLIASKVFISDINHGRYNGFNQDSPNLPPNDRELSTNPVFIYDNVWIGEGVCVMPGVTIGKGCIIGALSVVTKDIPDYTIAVGTPAIPIKKFDFKLKEWVRI